MVAIIDLFDRQVEEATCVNRTIEVGEDGWPLFGRDMLHRVDAQYRVEVVLERELLQPDMHEGNIGVLLVGHGEHAGGLISANYPPPGGLDKPKVRSRPARSVED